MAVRVPPELADVVEALDATDWAVELTDAAWRLVWSSREVALILGAADEEDLGVGKHFLETRRTGPLRRVTTQSGEAWLRLHAPYIMHDTGATPDALATLANPAYRELLAALEPAPAPACWPFALRIGGVGGVRALGFRLVGADGRLVGNAFVYGSPLPASLLALVARGDRGMFERMTELIEPGRRQAAILFADVEGSTDRSRRLPSDRYFTAIRSLTSDVDEAILRRHGIVGKHAGDGVSAFFLAEQVGGVAQAARAAMLAAREIREAAAAMEGDWRMKIGVHWGATLYMGQFATSGRLEVTALGDEVNECARVQDAARGGELLASKALLERLDPQDAEELGVDPSAIAYVLVGELPGATEKARRDAGSLPVAAL